ncbi:hypothetical protein [Ekhidna sp.]|uniref:hypothetical protein n=1 Tax=Ekhidna sp. TaxID=2608089 RepID=UPI003B5BBF09
MKNLFTTLIIIIFTFPAFGQKTQSLEGMTSAEIRKLLITQSESEMALEMIKKHNTSRIVSYVFFGGGLALLVSQDPSNEKNAVLTGFYGGTFLIAGLITSIVANERLKKAAKIYEQDIQKAQLKPNIRSESTAFEMTIYPTPH